jgi:hypothetical protein
MNAADLISRYEVAHREYREKPSTERGVRAASALQSLYDYLALLEQQNERMGRELERMQLEHDAP